MHETFPSASPFPGKRGGEVKADWQEGATHLKAPRANGSWRDEQTLWTGHTGNLGIGCSRKACVAAASGHALAPSGLLWA